MQCVRPVSAHTLALLTDTIFSVSPQMQLSMKTKSEWRRRTFLLTFQPMEINTLHFTHLHLAAS